MENKELSNKELDAVSGGAGSPFRRDGKTNCCAEIFSKPVDMPFTCIGTVKERTVLRNLSTVDSCWKKFFFTGSMNGVTLSDEAGFAGKMVYIKACDVDSY